MNRRIVLWVVIGALFLVAVFLVFKAGSIGNSTGNVIDTSKMTADEKMNYEMHGVIPARFQNSVSGASSTPSSGMVGGC